MYVDNADRALSYPGDYYYADLMQWDLLKISTLFLRIVLFLTGTILLYGVIWYERCSADIRYRTLMNQMISHVCMIHMYGGFVFLLGFFVIFIIELQWQTLCDIMLFNARFFIVCSVTHLTLRQCIKYLYIYHWRFAFCVNDDFAAIFLLMFNVMVCGLFTFVAYFFGHHNAEITYHCCIGRTYSENIKITLDLLKDNGNSSMALIWFQKSIGPGK